MSELTADIEDHQLQRRRRRQVTAGAVVSVGLHLLLLAIFLFGLPEFPEKQEEQQQAVQVALVPPPEETPPPKAEEKPEEQAAPPKPPPKPQTPPPGQPDQAMRIPIPVLNPAYRFGDKDAGPKKALDGDAARKLETDEAKPEVKPQEAAGGKPAPSEADKKAEDPKPKPLPQTLTAAKSGADAMSEEEAAAALALPVEDDKEADKTKAETDEAKKEAEDAAKPEDVPDLKRAGKLYSNSDSTSEEAMIAENGIPPSERASRLCVTELREQLRHGKPSYQPELLPAYNLPSGTVLAVRKAAFRAQGQWFDLSFRCEVDKGATRVVSFAYAVGAPVPRAKWKERGFPAF
ncbi:DUF930 domain-containing protein [Rhizobium sp. PAMB 3174]